MNNDELIAAGHELAKCLDNEPLLDIAKMIVRLADKLDVTTAALREKTKQCEELAAESAALKSAIQTHSESVHFCEVCGKDDPCSTDDVCYALKETTATDAFLRELKAQARQEGAYFVANRMLAAWDAGFIEDTAKNAADIARMILTSTEFMADAPDGDFDRAFADSVLAEIASELHQGGAA
ncbi:hypothetical protein QMS95_04435 [Cronobacter sakazakii]|nr:hypothetical protein FZI15_00135 [Cronobacter sakazakii]MDK1224677.1 hypothetical protein [Cronobacter turicensis]KAB0819858.1 hypothetical protein FZI44_18715 [Cronobacter sakazakii]MDI7514727.1 hypothetical protein [Cronobacter sakazakii]MDI7522469.1 hypothetical protein [Cronobacter sakazakii]